MTWNVSTYEDFRFPHANQAIGTKTSINIRQIQR